MESIFELRRLTDGPRHHFFGFHDLEISSRKSGQVLFLAVNQIDRPPSRSDQATVCVLDPHERNSVREVATTSTFNFPQGARQQWLGEGDRFIVNQRAKSVTISAIYDVESGKRIQQLDRGCHVADRSEKVAYSIDYGRLHRLGGYGYVGIRDEHADEPAPAENGVFATDIESNKSRLLLSIAELVDRNERARKARSHHYLTHLSLNPRGDRLALLHRYRLPDGGEDSCLVTVATDGSEFRVLAQGFLSHFDWIDDRQIMIWGRKNSAASEIRNSVFLQNPLIRPALAVVKRVVRPFVSKTSAMQMSFLLVSDEMEPKIQGLAEEVLRTDGHPMVNPKNRDYLVVDTYPNNRGVRDLMLYQLSTRAVTDLGHYPMSPQEPSKMTVDDVAVHIRENIDVMFRPEQYAFTRSGLHCDLHPRWFADGKQVAFDSIHEGSRQLYSIDVAACLS